MCVCVCVCVCACVCVCVCVCVCRDQVRHRSSIIDAYNFEMTHCFSSDQVS